MEAKPKYKNRSQELERLINTLRNAGITHVEELTTTFKEFVKGYVAQLHMKSLTKFELEYVWQKLITPP